jgi:hypothetical protein
MKIKGSLVLAAVLAVSGCVMGTQAQDQAKETVHKKVRTLKGCLSKAEDRNEYNLKGSDGSTWEIKSDAVKLGPHVGHTVAVTGVVANATIHGAKEDVKNEAKEHGMDKGATEHGHMSVTNLKMISESCDR